MSDSAADPAFVDGQGRPRLARSAFLYVDLLGVRDVSATSPAEGLRRLDHAIRRAFRDFLAADSPWPSAFFSDTLVVASPFVEPDLEEAALGGLIIQAASLQLELVEDDWFLRGGLALNDVHVRDGLVFGPALIDAYDVERRQAVHPRIVLSAAAVESQRKALDDYGEPTESPENGLLLQDTDGLVFIDYLSLVFDEVDPHPVLLMHRDRVISRLERHRSNPRVWEKYRWVAEYHNHTCRLRLPGDDALLVPDTARSLSFSPFVAGD